MKTSISNLLESREAISYICNECDLPGDLSFDIITMVDQVNVHLSNFDKVKDDLIKKYGKDVDGRKVVEKGSKDFGIFHKEYLALLDKKVDINDAKIPLDILKRQENIKPKYFKILSWMISS